MKAKWIWLIVAAVLVIAAVLGVYFGWYAKPNQVASRCHKVWVESEGNYYTARGNFYDCMKKGGVKDAMFGDQWFKWEK